MLVLAIETSCDETAAAIVDERVRVLSSVVSTQVELHAPFGGVVPEIASRAHLELVLPVVQQAVSDAGIRIDEVELFAATRGPGLAGALIVGVAAAKAFALVFDRPFVGVNHHEGHLYAAVLQEPDLAPPFMTLIVSGGHTMIVATDAFGCYRILGRTVDDAAGEAFDKVARYCGLGYPGGPIIDQLAATGDPLAVRLPRPMLHDGYDFSFSGLKTAVVRYFDDHPQTRVVDLAAGFQAAAVEVLTTKLVKATVDEHMDTMVIGGGVAANSALRAAVVAAGETAGIRVVVPDRAFCTDNAAMIGAAALAQFARDGSDGLPSSLASSVVPGLRLS